LSKRLVAGGPQGFANKSRLAIGRRSSQLIGATVVVTNHARNARTTIGQNVLGNGRGLSFHSIPFF
jgi:hypothetical protein